MAPPPCSSIPWIKILKKKKKKKTKDLVFIGPDPFDINVHHRVELASF